MSLKPLKVQFNGGELSPWLEGRTDISKYNKTAKLCRNFIPLTEGSLKRRGGSRFVAMTPVEEGVKFCINPMPMEALVIINGVEQNSIEVARGDYVTYEVKAEGYASKSGKVYVVEDKIIDVGLVSLNEMCSIKIVATPVDATIKIDGYERDFAEFNKNSEVSYMVFKDGYVMQSGNVVLDENKVIEVNLEVDESNVVGAYGDWGEPVCYIATSHVGDFEKQDKCILIKFEKGYLPIVFNAKNEAPDKIDDTMFIRSMVDGYSAVAYIKGEYILCNIRKKGNAVYYEDLLGNLVLGISSLEQKIFGWECDEDGNYATYYKSYDGSVNGNVINIYRNGKVIFQLNKRS